MTSVYKESEVKMKMVQEQCLQPKMKFLLGYNIKIVIYGGNISWWGRTNSPNPISVGITQHCQTEHLKINQLLLKNLVGNCPVRQNHV